MKAVLCAIGLAIGCSLAAAQGAGTGDAAGTGGKGATGTGSSGAASAKDYWTQHSKDGYMSSKDASTFKGHGGPVDMKQLDTDNDGRISEQEWNSYNKFGATGTGDKTTK